jgi:hypothetical protein
MSARSLLGLSEEETGFATPRRLNAMIRERKRYDKEMAKTIGLYTALWMSGQNPDDLIETDSKGLAGIDYPADDGFVFALGG